MDTTESKHKGLLTADDMANWSATIEKPLSYDYKNYTVVKLDHGDKVQLSFSNWHY